MTGAGEALAGKICVLLLEQTKNSGRRHRFCDRSQRDRSPDLRTEGPLGGGKHPSGCLPAPERKAFGTQIHRTPRIFFKKKNINFSSENDWSRRSSRWKNLMFFFLNKRKFWAPPDSAIGHNVTDRRTYVPKARSGVANIQVDVCQHPDGNLGTRNPSDARIFFKKKNINFSSENDWSRRSSRWKNLMFFFLNKRKILGA